MRDAMREASELVLPGFPLRTDAKVVRHPDRYADDRGRVMWGTVQGILDGLDRAEETPPTGVPKPLPPVGAPPILISSVSCIPL